MEKYIYIGLGIALLIAMIYPVVTAERRRRSAILGKIVSAWGQVPKREYEYSEFEKIAKYYKATKGNEFTIDDITWNDLDMDRIFMMINNTSCSTGEEYLYKMLRTPVFDQATWTNETEWQNILHLMMTCVCNTSWNFPELDIPKKLH